MGVQGKLSMALQAAEEAAATLSPTDRVAAITFADTATVDAPFRPASVAAAMGLVGNVQADGNTDIFEALVVAERTIASETSAIRHILLLTDGEQSSPAFFTDLVTRMRDQNITITTVGLGDRVAEFFLKSLARQGGGRFFFAPGPKDLPRVLIRDTRRVVDARLDRATKAGLADPPKPPTTAPPPSPPPPPPAPPATPAEPPAAPTTPPPEPPPPPPSSLPLVRERPHEALSGVGTLPSVGAPRRGRLGPGGTPILRRAAEEPVLAAGRPGLGRVLVLALPLSDPSWRAWAETPRVVAQAARSVIAPAEEGPVLVTRVTAEPDGDRVRISVPDGIPLAEVAASVRVTVPNPTGEVAAVPLGVEDGEVVFRLPTAAADVDVATVRITVTPPEGEARVLPPLAYVPRAGRPVPTAPPDADGLAAAIGAPLLSIDDGELPSLPRRRVPRDVSLVPHLLLLALVLLLVDAALHRRTITPGRPR